MSVETIVINLESIEVISDLNGIKKVESMNFESSEENEISNIFEKYNLNEIINYEFDPKIVRALKDDKEQLINYLDACRRADNSKHKVDIPDNIPQITYNYKGIRDAFRNELIENYSSDNTKLERYKLEKKNKQLAIYKQAKKMQDVFGRKVDLRMSVFDKAYFTIQEFLQRNQRPVLALNPATKNRRNKWEVDRGTKEATVEVSHQLAKNKATNVPVSRNNSERSV